MRDWPDQDVLTASVSSTGTTLTVADATRYARNFHLEIDAETMTVTTTGIGTSVPVRRDSFNDTITTGNASHATNAVVLINPNFRRYEIIDAMQYAVNDAFPLLYKEVVDTSLTTTTAYEYNVPVLYGTIAMPYVSSVEIKPTGETDYRLIRDYSIIRGTTPKIKFHWQPDSGATVRVRGYGPFQTQSGQLDSQIPDHALHTLVLGSCSYLTASGEAGRLRADTGLVDSREQSNKTGSGLSMSNSLYQRFREQLNHNIMPRMPVHCKPTF
jgi:hypothetical protein